MKATGISSQLAHISNKSLGRTILSILSKLSKLKLPGLLQGGFYFIFQGIWGKRSGQKKQFYSVQQRNVEEVNTDNGTNHHISDDEDAS